MKAYTYISHGKFELIDKPKPKLQGPRDAIVRITLGSICTSDLHIKHGSVPRAVPGITVGHEMVGVVEEVGAEVRYQRNIRVLYAPHQRRQSRDCLLFLSLLVRVRFGGTL